MRAVEKKAANKKAAALHGSGDDTVITANNSALPQKLNTVLAETLARLLIGQGISQQDAIHLMSCTRLSSVIHDLRHRYGWDVWNDEESSATNDGRTAHYARYFLPETELAKLSEEQRKDYANRVFAARQALREGKS